MEQVTNVGGMVERRIGVIPMLFDMMRDNRPLTGVYIRNKSVDSHNSIETYNNTVVLDQ